MTRSKRSSGVLPMRSSKLCPGRGAATAGVRCAGNVAANLVEVSPMSKAFFCDYRNMQRFAK